MTLCEPLGEHTHATNGTHMLSRWYTQGLYIYINADSQEFTIFWKKSSSISVSCPTRHGPVISLQVRVDIHLKKTVSIVKYLSILTDYHLKYLLILGTSVTKFFETEMRGLVAKISG